MTNLKEVNFGMNQYCGPSVLSIFTGESTDRCAAVISSISGKREIKAVDRNHLREAFKKLRFDVEVTNFGGSTLYGTLHRMHQASGLYVIFVPHHVIAVEVKDTEIYICDNHSKQPLDIRQSARLMQKVEAVWRVFPRNPPKFIGSSIRLDRKVEGTNFRIDIYSVNRYENSEDDNQYSLGYIRYKDNLELKWIVDALQKEFFHD